MKKFEELQKYYERIIELIGDDPSREGLVDTPKRVARSFETLFSGYGIDNPQEILKTTFNEEHYDEIVLLENIEIYSTCEHHLLPFTGRCHIGYIPDKKVVGISKLARVAEAFARRLQLQERLTNQIAKTIQDCLEPQGVGVVIEAQHFCMLSRGIQKQNSVMVTSAMYGAFRDDPKSREELMSLIRRRSQ